MMIQQNYLYPTTILTGMEPMGFIIFSIIILYAECMKLVSEIWKERGHSFYLYELQYKSNHLSICLTPLYPHYQYHLPAQCVTTITTTLPLPQPTEGCTTSRATSHLTGE